MDTESSRRSFDRSRELGVKKPRLTEDGARNRNPNGYGLLQRSAAPETSSVASRLRATERVAAERDDPSRGGGYKPQHPHQELVSQYKMALSELTFNSKPIITNLTIIAGENQEAAKAIATTICSNIIEVPSDQKLPSLYLLDSIVKNIGRDYVKYFAARLPEVFCKAYRQVDSSIHTGMRHLFGTWKGVFPLQPLQIIEKELGFSPAVNGSSSVPATSRSDLQSQRPPHSIHVNPKYLEARQRLQQSNRAKEMTNELTATVADATEVVERLDRAAGIGAAKTWADLPVKMHNLQRPQSGGGPVHEKSIGTAYENYKYGPDFSKGSGLEVGRASERATELRHDKSRYAAGSGVAKAISNRGNGFAVKHKSPDYSTTSSVNADVHVGVTQSIADRNNGVLSTNWKNSEEEEYMWDDMNPRLNPRGAASSLKKYPCAPVNARNLDPRIPLRMNNFGSKLEMDDSINLLSTEQKEWALFGDKATSPWSIQEPQSIDGLSPSDSSTILSGPEDNPTSLSEFSTSARSSLVRTGLRPPVGPSPSGGSSLGPVAGAPAGKLGQQWPNAMGNASPSGQSPMHQHPPSPSYPGSQAAQIPGQLNVGLHNQLTEDSITIHSQNLQTSSPSFPSFQLRHQVPYSRQLQADPTQPEPSLLGQKLKLPQISNFRSQPTMGNSSPDHSNGLRGDFDGQSNPSSLLAAVMKSGILTNNSVTDGQRKIGCQNTRPLLQSAVQPPLPSGPPSGPKDASTTLLHSLDKASNSGNHSQRKVELPPLPLGLPQPSSTSESASAPISNEGGTTANPFSNLLSSLVAKGLISASKTESPGLLPPQNPMKSQNQSSSVVATGSMSVSSAPVSLATLISPIKNEVSLLEPDLKSSAALPESIAVEVESLVGFEFKPDVIRQFHPSVVSGLVDDLPHRCSICGLRLGLKERLDRHLEWHASKKPETDSLCRASRKWYIHSSNWITRGLPSGFKSADMLDGFDEAIEKNEQMVPADESQCICILCGELFEDFYSQERDEWMFKDAVYMTLPTGYNEMRAMKDGGGLGPIVHANCISKSSAHDFGLVNGIKLEEDR